MRELRRRAQNVVTAAKRNATGIPVDGADNPEGRGPRRRTWDLYKNIRYEIGIDDLGHKFAVVFTDTPYAIYLETGVRGGRTYPFLLPALRQWDEL